MGSKLTVAAGVAYFFILCSMAMHIVGLLTDFWFVGKTDDTGSDVQEVSFGLWDQTIVYSNNTELKTDATNIRREEQYIVVAVTGTNTLLCLVVLIRNIHMCVGLISFIVMSLMILSAFFSYEGIKSQQDRLQSLHSDWPELNLAWSFYLVFSGIIVNIVCTLIFLSCLLVKGEMEATRSSKGFGPNKVDSDKTPIIGSVSGELNYANDTSDAGMSYSTPIGHDVLHHPGTSNEATSQGYDNVVFTSTELSLDNDLKRTSEERSETTDLNDISVTTESCRL